MERQIFIFKDTMTSEDADVGVALNDRLNEGWILDPDLKIVRLDHMAIYHLIKYSEEELQEMKQQEEENEPRITNMVSVDLNDADEYLAKGYEVQATYAKTVTLVKKESA